MYKAESGFIENINEVFKDKTFSGYKKSKVFY